MFTWSETPNPKTQLISKRRTVQIQQTMAAEPELSRAMAQKGDHHYRTQGRKTSAKRRKERETRKTWFHCRRTSTNTATCPACERERAATAATREHGTGKGAGGQPQRRQSRGGEMWTPDSVREEMAKRGRGRWSAIRRRPAEAMLGAFLGPGKQRGWLWRSGWGMQVRTPPLAAVAPGLLPHLTIALRASPRPFHIAALGAVCGSFLPLDRTIPLPPSHRPCPVGLSFPPTYGRRIAHPETKLFCISGMELTPTVFIGWH